MRRRKRGVAMIEFTFAGIATIFLLICTFNLSVVMWQYHTLAFGIHQTGRFMAVKGVNCRKPGNTCAQTVANIAQKVQTYTAAIPSDRLNLTLTTQSGAVTTCSPITTCSTNTTIWPPSTNSDNQIGNEIKLSASYQVQAALILYWPGGSPNSIATVTLPADSTQKILF